MDSIVLKFKTPAEAEDFEYEFRDAWGSMVDTEFIDMNGIMLEIIPDDGNVVKWKRIISEWHDTYNFKTMGSIGECCDKKECAKETKAQRAMRVAETENGRKFRAQKIENKKKKAPKHKFSYESLEESYKKIEASYESIDEICAKNGFEVIDSDVDPDTWVIYQKDWEDDIEEAPGFYNLISDLEELDGFKWIDDDTDRSAIVCWNKNIE